MTTSNPRLSVTADNPRDIHRAYLGSLACLVDNDLNEVEVVLEHNEPANAVRGYGSALLHEGMGESNRLTGGGTYYHLQTEPDNRNTWENPTRCFNIVRAADQPRGQSKYRQHFQETMVSRLNEAGIDDPITRSNDTDIYVHDDTGLSQVVGSSLRYFSFTSDQEPHGAWLYRACVQTDYRFKDALDASKWILDRDGISPRAYDNAVHTVPVDFQRGDNKVTIDQLVRSHTEIEDVADTLTRGYQQNNAKGNYGSGEELPLPSFLRRTPLPSHTTQHPQPCLPVRDENGELVQELQAKPVNPPGWYEDILSQNRNNDETSSNIIRIP